jgi:AraC-like DNA-binding protein
MTFQLPAGADQVSNEPPPDYSGPRLSGAVTLQGSTDTYNIIVQELSHQLYSISYHVFHFFKKFSFEYSWDKEGLHTHAALTNDARHSFGGIGKMNILEGQYAALWCKYVKGQTRFDSNEEYTIFDIFYSPSLAAEFSDAFPAYAKAINSGTTTPLSSRPQWLNVAMRDLIKQMLECPYDEPTRSLYFDLKVREYLLLTLSNIYDRSRTNYRFSPSETEKIFEARRLLLQDLTKPAYSIRALSLTVGLYESRLKDGFQHYFQGGVFETLLRARMEKTRELLLTTNKPIKEICTLAGYSRMSSFIKAFRKIFGYPPGELRRKLI